MARIIIITILCWGITRPKEFPKIQAYKWLRLNLKLVPLPSTTPHGCVSSFSRVGALSSLPLPLLPSPPLLLPPFPPPSLLLPPVFLNIIPSLLPPLLLETSLPVS